MYGGLIALRVLARKYEFKADVSWQRRGCLVAGWAAQQRQRMDGVEQQPGKSGAVVRCQADCIDVD